MNLSEEQLSMVEEMAGLFFSPEMIAINLELNTEDSEDFIYGVENKSTFRPIVAAYYKGWLDAEITLRKAIKQSAMNGSSPSQQMMINYKREGKI
jgi:hypothetical protein